MKRHSIAASLLTLLLLSSAVSCSDSDQTKTPATDPVDSALETEAIADDRPALGLEERDFGGAVYRISVFENGSSLIPESLTGEIVNDLTYERNRNLESKHNFRFELVPEPDFDTQNKAVSQNILAGNDSWELAACPARSWLHHTRCFRSGRRIRGRL